MNASDTQPVESDLDIPLRQSIMVDMTGGTAWIIERIVTFNGSHKLHPIHIDISPIDRNIFVMSCAHTLRDMAKHQSPEAERLINGFRWALSELGQIVFDVHVKPINVF